MNEFVIINELGDAGMLIKAKKRAEAQMPNHVHGLSRVQEGIIKETFASGGTISAAELVGRVYGRYASHMRTDVIYAEVLNLCREWVTSYPLLRSEGCGSPYDNGFPPPWENQISLTPIGELMRDASEDGPPLFPHLLVNGFSSSSSAIPPHCLDAIVKAILAVIETPNISDTEIQQIVGPPDFPSGCLVDESSEGVKHITNTKKATVRLQPDIAVVQTDAGYAISITRFPQGQTPQDIIENILAAEKDIKGLRKVANESLHSGHVRIEMTPSGDVESFRRLILTGCKAEVKFKCKMAVAAEGGVPTFLPLATMIRNYLTARTEFLIQKDGLTANQAKAKIQKDLSSILHDHDHGRIGEARKLVATETTVSNDPMVVVLTEKGMIRRLSAGTWRTQDRGGRGMEVIPEPVGGGAKDSLSQIRYGAANQMLIMGSTKGSVYFRLIANLMEANKDTLGEPVSALLGFENSEGITTMTVVDKINPRNGLLIVTTRGLIKQVSMENYESAKRAGRAAIKLNEGDRIASLLEVPPESDVVVLSSLGNVIKVSPNSIRAGSPATKGTLVMALETGETIVGACLAPGDDISLLTASTNGNGKLTFFREFKVQDIADKGINAVKAGGDFGLAVGCDWVNPDDEIFIGSESGRILRISAKDIAVTGKGGQGVSILKLLSSSDRLISISKVIDTQITEEADESAGDDDGDDES